MTLHTDYRPRTFDEFLGNRRDIDGILDNIGDIRVYLFHGPRGCGKTTLARLVASELGATGSNLYEYNGADITGVDAARAMVDSFPMRPLTGGCKMYVIDECHRLSPQAQDCLLKPLEEPPGHCYIALCTTAPDKVSKTIQSRALRHRVRPLRPRELGELLGRVAAAEGLEVPDRVINAIARNVEGIPRDALVVLDSVKHLGEDDAVAAAREGSGTDFPQLKQLQRVLVGNDPFRAKWADARTALRYLRDADIEGTRRAVLGYVDAVVLGSVGYCDAHVEVLEHFLEPMYTRAELTYAVYRACMVKF